MITKMPINQRCPQVTASNYSPHRRKVYLYQKSDYESMRKDTLEFAKENTSMITRILVQYRRTLIC